MMRVSLARETHKNLTHLNRLMHMVVNVLAGYRRCRSGNVLAVDPFSGVLEAGRLLCQMLPVAVCVIMLKGTVLDAGDVVVVLLGEHVGILDGLDRGVVVVLVDLLVHGRGNAILLIADDRLICDGGCYTLMDGGIMLAILADEALDCFLCGLHLCCGVGWCSVGDGWRGRWKVCFVVFVVCVSVCVGVCALCVRS